MTIIVMTGGSSGLGEFAAREMMRAPQARLLLGARGRGPTGAELFPLDLSSLDSARAFAAAVEASLGEAKIDALVLNAGTNAGSGDRRTPDGFEWSFVVNHLAHYLLLRLLLPKLAQGATIVFTTSGTHDPAEKTMIPPPRHADARMLAHPELDPERDQNPWTAAGRAYASSKLCVILMARGLLATDEARALGLTVLVYCPGLTPGTGLVRSAGLGVRFGWWLLGTPLGPLLVSGGMSTREGAGRILAELALGKTRPPAGRIYAALRRGRVTWPDPSELARRDDAMAAMWRDSAELVALPT